MSLFGSLFTGVSALSAQSQSLGIISNNIANVNTTGYKRSVAAFSSLVTASGRTAAFSPGGVRTVKTSTVDQQGLLQQSTSTTDVAISGNGFFTVQRGLSGPQETLYSRAGQFSEDSRGFLRNSSGFYLMGWPLDNQGNLPAANSDVSSLQPVDVAFLGGLTRPTSEAELVINLDARQDDTVAGPHFSRAIRVYDSLGEAQELLFEFTRQTPVAPAPPPHPWQLQVRDGATNALLSTVNLEFTDTGALQTPAPGADGRVRANLAAIDWGNGSAAQDISIDITDFTMFAGEYNVVFADQNGAELGLRTGVSIDREGYVNASFSNGATSRIYKLPVATFANPNGLEAETGNVFSQTFESGDYNLREAGKGGAGLIAESSLEASNVDLAEEFSRMIITQRAYSAGTRLISTSDQMLTELMQLR